MALCEAWLFHENGGNCKEPPVYFEWSILVGHSRDTLELGTAGMSLGLGAGKLWDEAAVKKICGWTLQRCSAPDIPQLGTACFAVGRCGDSLLNGVVAGHCATAGLRCVWAYSEDILQWGTFEMY